MTKWKETEIGKIPEDWGLKKLKDLFEIYVGGDLSKISFSKKKTKEYKYPIYSNSLNNSGLYGFSKSYQYEPGCVTITARGDVGRAECRKDFFCAIVRLLVLKPKCDISCQFVANFINSKLDFSHVGSAVNQLTAPMISDRLIAIPPFPEQKAIAKVLSTLDSKIELNNQMNATLESMAQAIFKHWFIDFEFPDESGKPYRSSGGKMVDSELGRIPEGWKVCKFGDYGAFKNGINYLRDESGDTQFFIVNVRDIANNKLLLKESLDKIKIDFKKAKEYLLDNKDILIARSASPGEVSLVFGNLENVIYSGFSIRYKLNTPNNYLYIFLIMQKLKENISNFSIGTTLQSVNQETLKNMRFVLPSDKVLKEFNKTTEQILERIHNNLVQNVNLSQIRDSLLPKLMSGRIRVPILVEK